MFSEICTSLTKIDYTVRFVENQYKLYNRKFKSLFKPKHKV